MANNNHGHHENHEHHHGHDHDHGHGHGHGNGDTDEDTLTTPLTFTLQPGNQAIVTVAFYGPIQKQVTIKDQSGTDNHTYTSCMDGRRPYIVVNNTSTTQTLYYTITPAMFANTCNLPVGSPIDLVLKGTINAASTPLQTAIVYGYYTPATSYYPDDQVGVTIVLQTEIGDLLP